MKSSLLLNIIGSALGCKGQDIKLWE